ncbi:MAG: tetratricopeptide repeat protein [bacterium]
MLFLSGAYAYQAGKVSLAEPLVKRLIEIDPLTPLSLFCLGLFQWMEGQLDLALSTFEKITKLVPEDMFSKQISAYILAWQKNYDKVFELVDQMLQKASHDRIHANVAEWCLFFKYALQGEKAKAFETLTEDVKRWIWNDPESVWLGVSNYALIDEKEEALIWLEHAVNRGWINYPLCAEKDPFLENIRGEPRFKKIMKGVKYEWENFEV